MKIYVSWSLCRPSGTICIDTDEDLGYSDEEWNDLPDDMRQGVIKGNLHDRSDVADLEYNIDDIEYT